MVTLAGLLAWNGVVLLLIGSRGTVILQNDFVIGLANNFMAPDGGMGPLAIVCIVLYAGIQLTRAAQAPQRRAARPTRTLIVGAARSPALAAALAILVAVCNQDRGAARTSRCVVGGLFLIWTFVLNRTSFGRHIYAVGGNAEAARRAGINVDNVRIACFAICSLMAVIGGIILASRLRSVDTNTGGGQALLYPIAAAVIGGTSLFGGRGTMKAAMLGALVMLASTTASACSGCRRARSSCSPAACCCWPSRSTRSPGAGARRADEHDGGSPRGRSPGMSRGTSPGRWCGAVGSLSTADINARSSRARARRRASRWWPSARATARAARRSPSGTGSGARTAPTRRCSPIPTIDAVYIPLPNSMHVPWTMRALEAGKHVLCEKPLTRHAAEVEAAFDAAERPGRRADGGVHVAPPPADRSELVRAARRGRVGRLRLVRASFSFPLARRWATSACRRDLDGGALMDVGCYCVSGCRLRAGGEPERVHGRAA